MTSYVTVLYYSTYFWQQAESILWHRKVFTMYTLSHGPKLKAFRADAYPVSVHSYVGTLPYSPPMTSSMENISAVVPLILAASPLHRCTYLCWAH